MTTTITARALGTADYGRFALVMAAIWMVKQFVDLRTWEGVTLYVTVLRGIDVSKAHLDVYVRPSGDSFFASATTTQDSSR